MSFTTAGAFQTVVDSGREKRTNGVLKHLGLADVSSLRVCDNLLDANTLKVGKGVEVLFVKPPTPMGYVQCFDRDIQAYLPLSIVGNGITLNAQGGRVTLPANTATEFWDSKATHGTDDTIGVTAWSNYDIPGMVPVTFTLRATAMVRVDWWCQFAAPAAGVSYFKPFVDGATDLDVPCTTVAGAPYTTVTGFGVWTNVGAGVHTAKLTVTPTANGTFSRVGWYTRFSVTASYA